MQKRNWLIASVASAVVTLGLFGGAYAASDSNERLAHVLYWQGYWLQSLVLAATIGSEEHPLYEANPIHIFAHFTGLPFGFLVYFLFTLMVLRIFTKQRVAQQAIPADRADGPRSC
jgi:hypothetical protein